MIAYLGFSCAGVAQETDRQTLGWSLFAGGASISIISATTPLEWSRDPGMRYYQRPFHQNPAHMAGLISGVGVSAGGILTLITSRKSGKRR